MSNKRGGVLSAVAGAQAFTLEGSCSYSVQRFTKTSVMGLTGPAGHKREPKQPFVEIAVFDDATTDVEALVGITGITVQLDLYNGKQVTLFEADQVGDLDVDAAEGTFTLRFEGPRGKVT